MGFCLGLNVLLADTEYEQTRFRLLLLQHVTGLVDQVRDVEGRQWIRALDHEQVASRKTSQRFACFQGRQRASEAAEIECRVRHGRNGLAGPVHVKGKLDLAAMAPSQGAMNRSLSSLTPI